jgi:hypothetical protein
MQDPVNGERDILLPAAPAINADSPVAPPLSAPLPEQNDAIPHDQPPESSSIANNTDPPPPIPNIFPAVVFHSTPPPLIPKQESKPTLAQREPREKKDSWKKKEAKETTSTPLPPPPQPTTLSPQRLRPPPSRLPRNQQPSPHNVFAHHPIAKKTSMPPPVFQPSLPPTQQPLPTAAPSNFSV